MANRYKKPAKSRARRTKPGRVFLLKAVAGALVLMAVLYAATWAAGRAWRMTASLDLFGISGVEVSGLKHVRKGDLLAYMGEMEGTSIFRADLGELAGRLRAHPWIKCASVKRELPDGLRLALVEREPAAVALAGEARYLVDSEGVVLAGVGSGGWEYLPGIICDSPLQPAPTGGKPSGGLVMALELIGSVRREPTELLAGAVVHLGRDGVPYMVVDGAVVELGRDGYDEKVQKLAEIFNDVLKRGVAPERIDLRFPGKVIVDGGRDHRS